MSTLCVRGLCRLLLAFLYISVGLLSPLFESNAQGRIVVGAERMPELLPLLSGKRVAVMVNQSSVVGVEGKTHLLDTLLSRGVRVTKVFVPEHGFRGVVDAGKAVRNDRDERTGLPIVSLYGKVKKPTSEMLRDVDVVVLDLQDVGARFYTYISSMHYLMEATAEQGKELVVCDRPNPNDYVDGPILQADCRSFIGMHPIPVVHGLTMGELAQMINGEGWLPRGEKCQLRVVTMFGWRHGQSYSLPIRPSPNLQDDEAIRLYPSLCFFEATIMSVGRGTSTPFRVLGYPSRSFGSYSFVPTVQPGADSSPMYQGRRCWGEQLSSSMLQPGRLSLRWLIAYYNLARREGLDLVSRRRLFELIVGNKELLRQLREGKTEVEIRSSWEPELEKYRRMRTRYLLYP